MFGIFVHYSNRPIYVVSMNLFCWPPSVDINNIKIQAMILGSSTYKYGFYINGTEIEVKPIIKILRVTTEEQISTTCELACSCYRLTCCTPLMFFIFWS